jgi:hypothetical protein
MYDGERGRKERWPGDNYSGTVTNKELLGKEVDGEM